MNRGINDQKDLPREYLEAIYDEIASNEIKMNAPGHQKVAAKQLGNGVSLSLSLPSSLPPFLPFSFHLLSLFPSLILLALFYFLLLPPTYRSE